MDYLKKIGENWKTEDGLRNHSIAFFFLTYLLYKLFPKLLILWLILLLTSLVIFYFSWKLARRVTVLLKKANIIFVLHNATRSKNISKYLLNFQSYFLQNVNQYLPRQIRVEFKPEDLKICSHVEAERLVQNGYIGHTLIIWAEYCEFKNQIRCKNTSFTYEFGYRKLFPSESMEKIKENFSHIVQKEINSFIWNLNLSKKREFDIYIDNIFDISLYILSRTLMSIGEFDKGVLVAKEVLRRLYTLNFVEQIKRNNIIAAFKDLLFNCYMFKANKSFYSIKKNLKKCSEYVFEALIYKKNDYYGNLFMSYLQETYYNDELKSLEHLDIAKKNKTKFQNSYLITEAYFAIKNKNYANAARIYEIISRQGKVDTDVILLIEDLRQRYEKTKELAFLFAEGFFKFYWLPQENGIKILKSFYDETEGLIAYEPLRKLSNIDLNKATSFFINK